MLNYIILQAAQPEGAPKNDWTFWIMMLLIFVVFYFFMIRPQTKRQKELQQKRDAIKKGDKVITAGGIYGEVKEVQDVAFLLTISKDVVIKVDKSSVTPVEEAEPKKDDENKK